jgi:DNA recombination protein RmuC
MPLALTDILSGIAAMASLLCLIGVAVIAARRPGDAGGLADRLDRLDRGLREDFSAQARLGREEMLGLIRANQAELAVQSRGLREEVGGGLKLTGEAIATTLRDRLDAVTRVVAEQSRIVAEQLDRLRGENTAKLEQMRQTVDEKLQGTLEKRLGDSFRQVSERLEQVHKGLGEMQSLASGVGDLKRVLTNVKTRGSWGEVQLGNLLEQIFTIDQYLRETPVRPGGAERVEYAIRLPGRGDGELEVLLPIDSKFPNEDYERLQQAVDRADPDGVEAAGRALEARIKSFARDIRDKYVVPPHTTDFAILFLPTEGLYAEVLRRPGLLDVIQREFRVTLAGPTTLIALLNALSMGFRTLAIQKRSSEVWEILGAVKSEFGKYGEMLDKVQKKLQEASKTIDDVAVRKRAIDRRLRAVESLPESQVEALLPALAGGEDDAE